MVVTLVLTQDTYKFLLLYMTKCTQFAPQLNSILLPQFTDTFNIYVSIPSVSNVKCYVTGLLFKRHFADHPKDTTLPMEGVN